MNKCIWCKEKLPKYRSKYCDNVCAKRSESGIIGETKKEFMLRMKVTNFCQYCGKEEDRTTHREKVTCFQCKKDIREGRLLTKNKKHEKPTKIKSSPSSSRTTKGSKKNYKQSNKKIKCQKKHSKNLIQN